MKSLYSILGIPDSVSSIITVIAIIMAFSPYAAGHDFGIFKIPKFSSKTNKILKLIGPVIFLFAVISFVPFWNQGIVKDRIDQFNVQLHVLPNDLSFHLNDPYQGKNNLLSVDIIIQTLSGSIGLTRKAKLIEQTIEEKYFVTTGGANPAIELLTVKPSEPVVNSSTGPVVLRLDFDTSSLIPLADYVSNLDNYVGHEFGNLKVALIYLVGDKEKSKEISIPLKFIE